MSTYEVVAVVGKTLKRLVWNGILRSGLDSEIGENDLTLSSPEEDNNGKLSIFLYNILEDSYQKNQGMLNNGSGSLKKPPTSLRLFYMITPHLNKGEEDKALKEHLLIGNIIQTLNDNPVLRPPLLEGILAGETLRLFASSLSLDEINKFWSIISKSKPYMLSLYYEVSPVRMDSTREVETVRVASVDVESEADASTRWQK